MTQRGRRSANTPLAFATGLVMLTVSIPAAYATGSGCRANPMANVRDPRRLKLLSRCETASGIVGVTRVESDGDVDVFLRPDRGSSRLINATNKSRFGGDLLLEIVPADRPGCSRGKPVPYGTCTGAHIATPKSGTHILATGPHVLDQAHGQMEIHPVWNIVLH